MLTTPHNSGYICYVLSEFLGYKGDILFLLSPKTLQIAKAVINGILNATHATYTSRNNVFDVEGVGTLKLMTFSELDWETRSIYKGRMYNIKSELVEYANSQTDELKIIKLEGLDAN